MERCLAVYNGIISKSNLRHRVLTALQVSALVAPVVDFAVPGLGTGSGVVLGTCAFAIERGVPEPKIGRREKVAALVHDSRQAFGSGNKRLLRKALLSLSNSGRRFARNSRIS
jgi:hypothetical protein